MAQTSSCLKSSGGTTLYDLIEAISEEVPPEEDRLVAEIVMHLFESGQIKFLYDKE